jgi:archaellum component FlaC
VTENDSSLTVKEWLSRIDGKLDTLNARMNAAELKAAMIDARVENNSEKVKDLDAHTEILSSRFNSILMGLGVGLFAGALAFIRGLTGS